MCLRFVFLLITRLANHHRVKPAADSAGQPLNRLFEPHRIELPRSFNAVFQATGTRILRPAVQAPRMNAICERLAGTLRHELLDRVLILGQRHLRAVLTEYQAHYTGRTRASRNASPRRTRCSPRHRDWPRSGTDSPNICPQRTDQ